MVNYEKIWSMFKDSVQDLAPGEHKTSLCETIEVLEQRYTKTYKCIKNYTKGCIIYFLKGHEYKMLSCNKYCIVLESYLQNNTGKKAIFALTHEEFGIYFESNINNSINHKETWSMLKICLDMFDEHDTLYICNILGFIKFIESLQNRISLYKCVVKHEYKEEYDENLVQGIAMKEGSIYRVISYDQKYVSIREETPETYKLFRYPLYSFSVLFEPVE